MCRAVPSASWHLVTQTACVQCRHAALSCGVPVIVAASDAAPCLWTVVVQAQRGAQLVPFLFEFLACFLVPLPQQTVDKQVGAVCLHEYWLASGALLWHVGDRGHSDGATGHDVLQRGATGLM